MQNWNAVRMYCPNCGKLLAGTRNQEGVVKVQCEKCGTAIVSKLKARNHTVIDTYAPKNQVAVSF